MTRWQGIYTPGRFYHFVYKSLSGLLKFLDIENFEGLAEATRVFGNLTRDRSVRDLLVQHKGMSLS